MDKINPKRLYLRIIAVAILSIAIIVFVIIGVFTTQGLHKGIHNKAIKAKMDILGNEYEDSAIFLNGEWEYFEDVVCRDEEDIKGLGDSGKYINFPIGTISQAKKNAAYRFRFKLPESDYEDLYFCIPTFDGEADIFLNGIKQEKAWEGGLWVSYGAMETFYQLRGVVQGEWQEIVISGAFEEQPITLYKRPVLIGSEQSLFAMVSTDSGNEMFLIGTLLLVMVNGYVFMLFRPNHTLISLITLFDSAIMARVLFSMKYILSFIKNIFPDLVISDELTVSLILFFLMIGGIIGCILSGILFDPERKVPGWMTKPIPFVYLIFAFLFPLNIGYFEKYGSILLIITYILTFMGVFWEFVECWKKKRSGYYLFQFIKTSYIGLVVFFDIVNFTKFIDFMALFYMYAIFFIMHVVVRLYDNNQTYKDVEILNMGLESTVEERTRELSEANKRLAELSVRDPLTGAYNRLYFENQMEKAMVMNRETGASVHMCMFDLDFFKSINDTYGHDVGDEQLRQVMQVATDIVGDDAVFARVGGEEFVFLFVGKSGSEVYETIEKVRKSIEYYASTDKKRTTASFGIAELGKEDTEKKLMKNADIALYQAKSSGRNCVVVHDRC